MSRRLKLCLLFAELVSLTSTVLVGTFIGVSPLVQGGFFMSVVICSSCTILSKKMRATRAARERNRRDSALARRVLNPEPRVDSPILESSERHPEFSLRSGRRSHQVGREQDQVPTPGFNTGFAFNFTSSTLQGRPRDPLESIFSQEGSGQGAHGLRDDLNSGNDLRDLEKGTSDGFQ